MRGLKGAMCVPFLCFHAKDSGPRGKKGPHLGCLHLAPLFRRRGPDLDLYHSDTHKCALTSIYRIQVSAVDITINDTGKLDFS